MRVTPAIILLASISASPILGRGAMTASSPQRQDRRVASAATTDAEKFHLYATKMEESLPGCDVGGVRLYLKNGNKNHCPIFHEYAQAIDDDASATAHAAIQPIYDAICQCHNSDCIVLDDYLDAIGDAIGDAGDLVQEYNRLKAACDKMPYEDCKCNAKYVYNDKRANYGCGGKTLECFQQLADEVKAAKTLYSTLTTISKDCYADTLAIDEAIKGKYDASAVSKDVTADEDGNPVTFVNFHANADYSAACVAKEGTYNALSYKAICDEINANTKKTVKTMNLIVNRHSRCFASSCGDSDRGGLLTSFATDPTETRNKDGPLFWLCIGQEEKGSTGPSGSLGSGSSGGLCDFETKVLSDGLDLEIAEIKVKADVKFKKFIFLFNRETRIVDFPGTEEKTAYGTACTAAGGFYNTYSNMQFICGEDSKFEVSNFAACLGETCKEEDQTGIDAAMATMFAKKMIDSKELERSVGCAVSGAGSLTMGVAATIAASLAALWHIM